MRLLLLLPLLCISMSVQAQSNFSATNFRLGQSAYTDISGAGTPVAMTHPDSGFSVSAVDIGFPFLFHDSSFTQFRLHADGIMRLGTAAPTAANRISISPANTHSAVFTSALDSFQYVILPFFTNLVAAGTPAYHVLTTGVAPNRVCTIQWKNLRDGDNSTGAVFHQFSQLEFQVKLYEGSNDIEFVYGTWTPSASTLSNRQAAVGIKATNTSFVANYKGIGLIPFSQMISLNARNNGRLSNGVVFRRDVPPPAGFSQRYFGRITNDVNIANLYVDSVSPAGSQSARRIEAMVTNEGSSAASSIAVTLQITGSNTHSATVNITSLAPGASQLVSFPEFVTANTGTQQVQVSVSAAADDRTANNTRTAVQIISTNHTQLPNLSNAPFGIGFNGAGGFIATKIYGTGSRRIRQIRVPFVSYRNQVNVRVYEDEGTAGAPSAAALITSSNFLTTNENTIVIPITSNLTVSGDYFIAVNQTSTTNMAWRSSPAPPIRTGRSFTSNTGASWVPDVDTIPWQYLVEVYEESSGPDVGIEQLAAPGCTYSNATDVRVTLRNFSSSTIDFAATPTTISGTVRNPQLAEFPFSILKNSGTLAAGASEQITVLTGYDYSIRGNHLISAKTNLPGDVERGNDSLRFFVNNQIAVSRSFTDSVCPLTPVTLTGPSFLANLQWTIDGVPSTGTTASLSPIRNTVVYVQGTDYRGCLLQDSVIVPVRKEYGAAAKPVILFGDTVLSHRNQFKDTLRVTSLAGHTVRWLGGLGTVSADTSLLLTQVLGLQNARVSAAYIRNTDGCGTLGDTLTYRYATGVLHNNNDPLTVCDTSYYDAGGATGLTGNSFTKVFTPATTGQKVKLTLYGIDLANFASIMVYDGSSTSSPRITAIDATRNGNNVLEFIASNEAGALTVQFNRASLTSGGWWAGLTCHSPSVYRTVQNGLWTNPATWERKTNGGMFVAANTPPFKADDSIYVQHDVLVNTSLQIDQVIVTPAGHLQMEPPGSNSIAMNLYKTNEQAPIEVQGSLTLRPNVQLFNNDKIVVSGQLLNAGKIDVDSVMMIGTTPQQLGVNGGPAGSIRLLHLNNAAGVQVLGTQNIERIRFLQGRMHTSTQAFVNLSGGNAAEYDGNNNSFIEGPVAVTAFGDAERRYPTGLNGQYRPVIINNNNVVSFDDDETILVQPIAGAPPTRTLPFGISEVSQRHYYRITRTGNNGSEYQITLPYTTQDGVTDPANLTIAKDDGAGAWVDIGGTATGTAPGTITSELFDTFSDFVLANKTGGNNVLPVTWISFTAQQKQQQVLLTWQTAQEVNCQLYVVERSTDGQHFTSLGTQSCANLSNGAVYRYTDYPSQTGSLYYRIRQQDKDGSSHYSTVRRVVLNQQPPLRLHPNPASTFLRIQSLSGKELIQLYDATGKLVWKATATSGTMDIPVAQLANGIYSLQILQTNGSMRYPILISH